MGISIGGMVNQCEVTANMSAYVLYFITNGTCTDGLQHQSSFIHTGYFPFK